MSTRPSALVLIVLVVVASFAMPLSTGWQVGAAPPETTIGARSGRHQFGVAGSGSILVWVDRAIRTSPPPPRLQDDPVQGSSDILGLDLASNQPLVVTAAPGDQTGASISGSVVVWQDNGHSCPGCEADIRGKDLATGVEFAVATGPADQSAPAIAGRTVVWIEMDSTHQRLLSRDLDGSLIVEITAVVIPGTTISPPAISSDLIVWSEDYGGKHHTIFALERATGQRIVIDDRGWANANYALSGRRIVWTDPQLWLTDTATGTTTLLDGGRSVTPAIESDQVVWNGLEGAAEPVIFGLDLNAKQPLMLVRGSSSQRAPQLLGDQLLWHSEENGQHRLRSTSRRQAFAQGIPRLTPAAATPAPTMPAGTATPTTSGASDPSGNATDSDLQALTHIARPTIKGIHAATGWGWSAGGAFQALGQGDMHGPYFGSVVVLSVDLQQPGVASYMQQMQSQGVRIIVRLYPTTRPLPNGSSNPGAILTKVLNLANTFPWIRDVQIDNEPNQDDGAEWEPACPAPGGCPWTDRNGNTVPTIYTSKLDWRRYDAIDKFYTDAWLRIQGAAPGNPNLRPLVLWTPPMTDIFQQIQGSDQQLKFNYDFMGNMLYWFDQVLYPGNPKGGMTYHTYPAPNYDAHLPHVGPGIIYNNSYVWGFPGWLQSQVDTRARRSMITEFGWNVGQMHRCGYSQSTIWPPEGDLKVLDPRFAPNGNGVRGTRCSAMDGVAHPFHTDILNFQNTQWHGAEVIAVWLVDGNESRSNGMVGGDRHLWLQRYIESSPIPRP